MSPTARGPKFRLQLLLLLVVGLLLAASPLHAKQFVQLQHAGFVATSSLGFGFHQHAHPSWQQPAVGGETPSDAEAAPTVPRFAHPLYNVSIAENSVGKTYAMQPPAEDRLGVRIADDLEVRFRIVGGDKEKLFKAEDRRVGDFAFLAIRTRTGNVILNREKIEEYRLDVRATITQRSATGAGDSGGGVGGGGATMDAATQVAVRVLDTNDLSPMFYPNEYTVTVAEDMALHRSILRVEAEDADLGINGEIYYSFAEANDQFAVHPSSGVLTLTRPLKFTDRSFHDLVVVATDRGASSQSRLSQASKATVHVKVKQVNLYVPDIHVHTLPDIAEHSNALIYGIVRVDDRDTGPHGRIASLTIVDGDPDGHFRIRSTPKPSEYNIEVHQLLDRERTPHGYNLTLCAVDAGTPPRHSYKTVPVHLADINDNPPVFNRELYEVSVPETSPPNTPVIRLKVSDRDTGRNALVSLEIVGGNEGGEFRVNADTGMLYTAEPLDAETKAFYTLTVSAIDQGNSGTRKQSSAKVKINVQDTNDNDPVFELANVTVWVNENEPAGTVVTKVTARDRDAGENAYISYSIANLNDVPFDIDHFLGTVRTSKLLDFETARREYVLRVRASDWGLPYRRQTEMQLRIRVRDVNDNRPQFERVDCVGQVARYVPIGTEVLTLSAIDFDAGNFIAYRMVSGNEDGCFSLDAASGVLSVACDLNDVGVAVRELNVTATDGTHFADVMRIQVNLVAAGGKQRAQLAFMGRSPNEDGAAFECRDTGVMRRQVEMLAAAERNNAPGGGRDQSGDDFAMMPSRYGENVHAPEFVEFPQVVRVNETVALGTTIAWIRARDRDLGYNGKLVFGISGGDDDSVFRLDPDTGELKCIGYLDRERNDEYVLNVTVYDLGRPQKSVSTVLPVQVLDENDNAPSFSRTLSSFRLAENALNGTVIVRLNATDADLAENGRVTYSLVTDTRDFRVDPSSGVLTVSSDLDRERTELYELRVRATDGGGLYADAIVRITIDDINDNPPIFDLSDLTVRVREDVPVGSVVAVVVAHDRDTAGGGGEVSYTLGEDSDSAFRIDRVSGTVRTVRPLDFEQRQVHSLIVRASDGGQPSLSAETSLIVEVIDVNENRFAPQFGDFVLSGEVAENREVGAPVMQAMAKDADAPGPDSRLTYSIRGGDGLGVFAIDSEGHIRTARTLDIETKPHYWLTVCAQDQAVVPLYACVQCYVRVLNVNDNVPLTQSAVYYPSVPESSPPGVQVIQLVAEDRDVDDDQRLTYRIVSGNPEGFFAINGSSGLITTTARKLDRENQPEHILEVMVSDNGTPELSSTTRVVIAVGDINDHSPEFDQKVYKVQIPATAAIGQPLFQRDFAASGDGANADAVSAIDESLPWERYTDSDLHGKQKYFRVLAIDRDTGENGRITYAIKSGKGKAKFRIHPDTGVIYAAKTFEPEAEFDLLVRAEDNGVPRRAQSARVSVVVLAVAKRSEHAPQVKTVDQHVEVTESDAPGFLVTLVQAYDEDNDQLWFDIVDGDPKNDFYIGRDNGNVLLARELDWETQRSYNLTVSVTDGVHTVHTQLYIGVIDINDHRPEFTDSVYRIAISEQVAEGTEVLQLHATDRDEDKQLFYSLHASRDPASLQLFRVDAVSGSLTLARPLDRELSAEHELIVIVKDQGTPAKRNYAKVLVTVHDYNDHAPEFTARIVEAKVFETAAIGSQVAQVYAVDADSGDNARITYTMVSGNIGNVFAIDPQMGIVSVSRELDIATLPEYMIQVRATDGGKPSLAAQVPVHVLIGMADNAAPRFVPGVPAPVEIYEGRAEGTFVMHVEVRSTSSVVYDIVAGNEADAFFVNPSTGVIVTKGVLDYEQNKFYNLTIRTTNMAGASATCSAIVHVLDRNDNAPVFVQAVFGGEIAESAPIASLVIASRDNETTSDHSTPLVIKATDADAGLNAMLHYDIVEPLPRRYFHIDSTTGAIKTVMLLDHETTPLFEFHVKVSDLGQPRLSSETLALVRINVTDVNDCPPQFGQPEYNVTLLLPTYPDVAVLQLNATDPDGPDTATTAPVLRFDIIEGNADGVFAIDAGSGVITTTRHAQNIGTAYKLAVRVSDGKFSKVTTVNVLVEQSENSGLIFQRPVYDGSIVENTTKTTVVTVVNVIGSALNEHVVFRLLNPTDMFKIGRTSGAVETTGKRFDREQRDNYELIVEARSDPPDRGRPRVAHVCVNVTILDINDNCPMFVNLPYYAVVSVDDARGSVITKVHALDADSFENGEVRYEMKRGHGELFRVERKSGEVVLKQSLEGHNRDYELIIAAYDGGITPCSTDVTVHVKVIDKSMPVFSKQFYSDTVPENIELHSPLSVAIQAESPLGRKLIYTIVKGNELEEFAVDFNTGAIYVVDELDYERRQSYELVVRATDSVSGVSAEVPVAVLVQDVNDCAPEFEHDSYNITVSEASPFGTEVLRVLAHDNDTGVNRELVYAIQTDSGNVSEYFHMVAGDGVVYLKKALDHEQQRAHHLTVVAADRGVPSLSATAHVWVTVYDMNDNPPRFEQPSYSCVLSQHAQRGQFVTVVAATDPDQTDAAAGLTYGIAQGNELQTYAIDSRTGVVTLVNMQNFADKHQTVLNVSVTDGVYTSFARVKVNIVPANLHAPHFEQLVFEVKVAENQLAGRLVMTVHAADEDFGDYGTSTYDIFSDQMREFFAIDKIKGDITTKVRLDREERRSYDIPVIATDGGGRSGFTTVRVQVGDLNDNAPVFRLWEYKVAIYGNATVNGTFLTLAATDADDNQNAAIKYALYDAENTGVHELFSVDADTGAMRLRQPAEPFANQMFQFFVRAQDGGSPSLHSDVPVDVYIMSAGDQPPVFDKREKILFMSEAAAPGTVITRLRLANNITATYRIVSEAPASDATAGPPQFAVNEAGELRVARALDREKCELHHIGVLAESDSSPALAALAEIQLHVQDENDNSPVFESVRYTLPLAENAETGSAVMRVQAHDADSGANGDIRYALANDAGELANVFDIDAHTGWITMLVRLDKEQRSEYQFQVIGTDGGRPKHSARTAVHIKLRDYNDCPPVFRNESYAGRVSEDALPGTVIVQLATTDADADLNTPTEFYIVAGDPLAQFQIRSTGELYVAKQLDRETTALYVLTVLVTDGTFTARTNVTVTVDDANDNPPYCSRYRYRTELSEAVQLGTVVLQVEATDADERSNSKLRFFLTGAGGEDFTLDKDSGQLRTARQLDRETRAKYALRAHVQDRDHSGWECSSLVEVVLSDVNDNEPDFSMQVYSVTLPEDAEVGTLVTKVHATDADIGRNRKIRYSFVDSYRDHFRIAADSGIVTLSKPLDRETKASYTLTVQAADDGRPQLVGSATVSVTVQDINDNPPEFTSKHHFAEVREDATVGTECIRIVATSKDAGVNADVYFSIIGGNEQRKFAVNRTTGVVVLADMLDYERARDYFLTIQAVDGGEPPLSNLATLNVSVVDANDNAPVFTQHTYTARIREDASVGDRIVQVLANDQDAGENGRISYAIRRGDRDAQFTIEPDTGYVSVAAGLDRETISTYVLEIEAFDNGQPPLRNLVLCNIEISDANDNPPVFGQHNYSTIVQEDKPLGHVLLRLDITDADAAPNGAPYTFDFRSGNEAGTFRLEQDGILRSAARFNHRVRDSYRLMIRCFDNGTPPLFADTMVHVQVIEESQYPPVVQPQEIVVNAFGGEEFVGGLIGRIFASDQDQYDQLQFALASTADVPYAPGSLFNVSRTDGKLYALPRLDVGEYRVNVTVSDGKFTAFTIVRIAVELIGDEQLANAVVMRFSRVSAEQFVLSHRKTFVRSVRSAMGARQKDVCIVAVQPVVVDGDEGEEDTTSNVIRHRQRRSGDENDGDQNDSLTHLLDVRDKRQAIAPDLDVLFTVRKATGMPTQGLRSLPTQPSGYYTPAEIRAALADKLDELEELTNLTVDQIVPSKCTTASGVPQPACDHGQCADHIALDATATRTIATDMISFVSARYTHRARCHCRAGYGGPRCSAAINECAANPCPDYKLCVPDLTAAGFRCVCPDGFAGPTCDRDRTRCASNTAESAAAEGCYTPHNPVAFGGKSYAQYRIAPAIAKRTIADQFHLQLRVRTLQPAGCLLFAAGKVDYNILELAAGGFVQYRFELGSGEGRVAVASVFVADGQWHEIRVEREGNTARVYVDGKHVAHGSAPGVNGILNLQQNDVFLGAEVRQHPAVLGFEDVQRGFVGCMDDVRIARTAVPLHMTGGSAVAELKRFANVAFSCAAQLEPLGVCGTQPCRNGGTCNDRGASGGTFECVCHERFEGVYCETDRDPCASAPCLFGGKCRPDATTAAGFRCECPARMSGARCDYGRFCAPNPCRNGGVCEEGDDGPLCMCRGYSGVTCELDVDECEQQPCGVGATCINEAGSFRCICPPDLTGASCGDPLYADTITSRLKNLPVEHVVGVAAAATVLLAVCVLLLVGCQACRRRRRGRRSANGGNGGVVSNNGKEQQQLMLNSVQRDQSTSDYKRRSKMSNLEIIQRGEQLAAGAAPSAGGLLLHHHQQRPVSYAAASGEPASAYACNTVFVNNLDTLRSYGSAGDQLENAVPAEYRKPRGAGQHQVNLNGHMSSDSESLHKQTWSDHMQLHGYVTEQQQATAAGKIHNDLKRPDSRGSTSERCATLKGATSGVLPGRLLNVPLPNPQMAAAMGSSAAGSFEDASSALLSAYHWDCSDWAGHNHNPLPNITEVPGAEVPDSSSFHSNESNESHPKNNIMPMIVTGPVDPARDIDTLNEEDLESEFIVDSEYEGSDQQPSLAFDAHNTSLPVLNALDSGGEDYRFSTADSYLRHPNSYLPRYNIHSETDGEPAAASTVGGSNSSGGRTTFKCPDIGPQQILETDEEANDDDVDCHGRRVGGGRRRHNGNDDVDDHDDDDDDDDDDDVPAYGFPTQQKRNRRNRRDTCDLDLLMGTDGEHNSLLGIGGGGGRLGASNSDVSTHLCEIDDSECELEATTTTAPASTSATSGGSGGGGPTTKSVKWAPSVHQTHV